jgi:hypothetical protein
MGHAPPRRGEAQGAGPVTQRKLTRDLWAARPWATQFLVRLRKEPEDPWLYIAVDGKWTQMRNQAVRFPRDEMEAVLARVRKHNPEI